jgi:hypothetical protein
MHMPSTAELFGGHRGHYRGGGAIRPDHQGTQVTEQFELYKSALRDAHSEHDAGGVHFVRGEGIRKGAAPTRAQHERRMEMIEQLSKTLPEDQVTAMRAGLDDMRELVAKDWNQAFPETGGYNTQLAPYNLEPSAKILVPRATPLRNAVPRDNTGKGSALQFRRILGWTNSNVGGVADQAPFLNSEYPASQSIALPSFGGQANTTGGVTASTGGVQLRRGQKINYAADSKTVNYTELSLSDSVSWKSQYIGQGFEDIRQLSHTSTLWAHMLGEEKALLYSRGPSANGYVGPITAPTGLTASSASTGGTIAAGTYSVFVTAVGGWGESAPSNIVTTTAITSTGTLTITAWPTLPSGATGWNVYVFTASTGSFFYQGFVAAGTPAALASGTVLTSYSTTSGTLPYNAADSSANVNGYDGFLTVLLNPALSGYVATYISNSTAANVVNSIAGIGQASGVVPQGDIPWQTMFKALYGAGVQPGNYGQSGVATSYGQKLLADPDVVYVDGVIRSALGTFVERGGNSGATGSAGGYRIQLSQDQVSGVQMGSVVTGMVNQTTGKAVDLEVHPFMPIGTSFAWSKSLPVPDSEVSNPFAVNNVVDYMGYDWPDIQFTYDFSTYQLGTFVPYAPAWSGAMVGLQA